MRLEHADLIGRCLRHLAPFRLLRQLTVPVRHLAPRIRALLAEHASHAQVHLVRSRRAANRLTDQLRGAAARG